MSMRPAPRLRAALRKNGQAAKATAGRAIAAETQCSRSRVVSEAPAQTATERSMTFIEAKPATPMRASRSRPSASLRVESSTAASSGRAS